MKVIVKGQGEVNLTQQHFVAMGGQASVYIRNGVAYKVYTDPQNAIPHDKFRALSAITDPCVIRPNQLLLSPKDDPVGYTMDAKSDTLSLCQLFTKAFRDRTNVTNDHIVDIASKMRGHVSNVHSAGVIIVDLNELNILVAKTLNETFFIDVDSYQTPGYPATVIMPSVRDWSAKKFSELSDWFSFGVLAFQLFIGCHPYKGTHPGSANVPKEGRMEHRMKNNLSAFRSDVSLPHCCYPMDAIPQTFRDWLKAVLDDGKRVLPPDPKGGPVASIVTQVRVLVTTGNLTITEVHDFEGWTIAAYAESTQQAVALIRKDDTVRITVMAPHGQHQFTSNRSNPVLLQGTTLVGFTAKLDSPVALNLHDGKLTFIDLNRRSVLELGLRVDQVAKSGDRFYIRSRTQVLEVEFNELPNQIVVTASHCVASVLEMASQLYEGCAFQSMLGSVFVSLFPRSKAGYQVRVPELDAYRVQDAKFEGGVLMVVGASGGKYDRLIFRFDAHYEKYDVRTVPDVDPSGLNFITLPTGVCVSLTEEEKVEAFQSRMGATGVKEVTDATLGNDMVLVRVNGKAGFIRSDRTYNVSLK